MRFALAAVLILIFASTALAERRLYDDEQPGLYETGELVVAGKLSLDANETPNNLAEQIQSKPFQTVMGIALAAGLILFFASAAVGAGLFLLG